MLKILITVLALGALTACAAPAPQSAADQADAAACTQAADATYRAQNYEALSRPSQNGLLYGATPTHVFDAQQLGALHERDSQITDCETNGNSNQAAAIPGQPVIPHIVQQN